MWGTRRSQFRTKVPDRQNEFHIHRIKLCRAIFATTQLQLSNYHIIAQNNPGNQIIAYSDIFCGS